MKENGKQALHVTMHFPYGPFTGPVFGRALAGGGSTKEKEAYLEALGRETAAAAPDFADSAVKSLILWGAAHTDPKGIAALLREFRRSFTLEEDAEIVLRCVPGSVSLDALGELRAAGVNKIDVELFSALEQDCAQIGLSGFPQALCGTAAVLCSAGFSALGLRMACALPGQGALRFRKSMGKLPEFAPKHIAFLPFEGRWEEENRKRAQDFFTQKGYTEYTKGCFAAGGPWRCYAVPETEEILGLGLGASSRLFEGAFCNTPDLARYLRFSGDFPMLIERQASEHTP